MVGNGQPLACFSKQPIKLALNYYRTLSNCHPTCTISIRLKEQQQNAEKHKLQHKQANPDNVL